MDGAIIDNVLSDSAWVTAHIEQFVDFYTNNLIIALIVFAVTAIAGFVCLRMSGKRESLWIIGIIIWIAAVVALVIAIMSIHELVTLNYSPIYAILDALTA